jgi:hypothetical protein
VGARSSCEQLVQQLAVQRAALRGLEALMQGRIQLARGPLADGELAGGANGSGGGVDTSGGDTTGGIRRVSGSWGDISALAGLVSHLEPDASASGALVALLQASAGWVDEEWAEDSTASEASGASRAGSPSHFATGAGAGTPAGPASVTSEGTPTQSSSQLSSLAPTRPSSPMVHVTGHATGSQQPRRRSARRHVPSDLDETAQEILELVSTYRLLVDELHAQLSGWLETEDGVRPSGTPASQRGAGGKHYNADGYATGGYVAPSFQREGVRTDGYALNAYEPPSPNLFARLFRFGRETPQLPTPHAAGTPCGGTPVGNSSDVPV